MKLYCMVLDTRLGWMGIVASAKGLKHITLPQASPEAVASLLGRWAAEAAPDLGAFGDLPDRLRRYFIGEKIGFPGPIDLSHATPFQRDVWQAARSIPYGETRSYAWLAKQIGKPKAWRGVGQALAANPLPIVVPCHRVIGTNGSLGGFSGGVELKKRLLEMEAHPLANCDTRPV